MAGALVGDLTVPRRVSGSLTGTPVVLACGDADTHSPDALVRSSAKQVATFGATVDLRIPPGMGHDITGDQIAALSALVDTVGPVARSDP